MHIHFVIEWRARKWLVINKGESFNKITILRVKSELQVPIKYLNIIIFGIGIF